MGSTFVRTGIEIPCVSLPRIFPVSPSNDDPSPIDGGSADIVFSYDATAWQAETSLPRRLIKPEGAFLNIGRISDQLRRGIFRWAASQGLGALAEAFRAKAHGKGLAGGDTYEDRDRTEALRKAGIVQKFGTWFDEKADKVLSEGQVNTRIKKILAFEPTDLLIERMRGRDNLFDLSVLEMAALAWAEAEVASGRYSSMFDGCIFSQEAKGTDNPKKRNGLLFASALHRWSEIPAGERYGGIPETVFVNADGRIYLAPPEDEIPTTPAMVKDLEVDLRLADPTELHELGWGAMFKAQIDLDFVDIGKWHWTDLLKIGGQIVLKAESSENAVSPSSDDDQPDLFVSGLGDAVAFQEGMSFVFRIVQMLSGPEAYAYMTLDNEARNTINRQAYEVYARGGTTDEAVALIRDWIARRLQ